ncbi:MAG: hypothetical protein V1779_10805 [bacterium]
MIFAISTVIFCQNTIYAQKGIDTLNGEKLMETVSLLVTTNLFQTYLTITLMNDNVDNLENYEVFESALFTLDKQLNNINDHLAKFNKSKYLKKEDFEYLFSLKEIIFELKEDIKLFKTFLEKGDDNSYTKFYIKHTKVNKKIEELLELEGTDVNEVDVDE